MTPGVAVQGGSDRRRQGNGAGFAERHGHPLNGVHVTRRHVAVMVPGGGTEQMFQCVSQGFNSPFYLLLFNVLMRFCVSERFTGCHKISDQ
ncbi:MAG: hypothetical protein VX017_03910, partial [Pseudomonadota bacterium]|nr:hypothetical protein [Pseudomonadota bacterium]